MQTALDCISPFIDRDTLSIIKSIKTMRLEHITGITEIGIAFEITAYTKYDAQQYDP